MINPVRNNPSRFKKVNTQAPRASNGVKVLSSSARETKSLGAAVGKKLKPGALLALTGDLGSGKTTFVQGLARGLGFRGRVKSPTFTIVNRLRRGQGRVRNFFHLDLYRVRKKSGLHTLGLPELVAEKNSVTAIEWPETARHLLPPDTILISFSHGEKKDERVICIEKSSSQ